MSTPHPNDKIEALKWAIKQAESNPNQEPMAALIYLPTLRSMHDEEVRSSRGM